MTNQNTNILKLDQFFTDIEIVPEPRIKIKYCKKCNTGKSLDEFCKDSKTKDGLFYKCKSSHRKTV